MTIKPFLVALTLSALLASTAIAAPPAGAPDQAILPSKSGSLTPPHTPMRCQTDLSIENIIIRQTSNPSVITLSVSVINLGPGARFEAPAGCGRNQVRISAVRHRDRCEFARRTAMRAVEAAPQHL